MKIRNFIFVAALASLLASASRAGAQTGATNTPFWTGMTDASAFERSMDARLAHARTLLGALLGAKGARSIDNTLRPYDEVLLELDAVSSQAQLVQSVHPDERMRQTAEKVSQKAAAFGTEISLNRGVFDALSALDAGHGDTVLPHAHAARFQARRRRQGRRDTQEDQGTARRARADRAGV